MAKRNYKEGHWFAVEVPREWCEDREVFGAGLIARGSRGWVVFVYLFGPLASRPDSSTCESFEPGGELMQVLVPDDGLRSGFLPIVGVDDSFSRERWPMPEFGMYMGGDNPAWAVRTDDDDPFAMSSRRKVDPVTALSLPQYAVSGYGTMYERLLNPESDQFRVSQLYRNEPSSATVSPLSPQSLQADFIAHSKKDCGRLAVELVRDGWTVDESERQDGVLSVWWLNARRPLPWDGRPSGQALAALDSEMQKLAERFGAEYDGHGFDFGS